MKNQYFGDINDYLKYGLLRCFAEAGLRVGVCWMLTSDDGRTDGRKVDYLSHPDKWRKYDPVLFDVLDRSIRRGSRRVRHIQKAEFLPAASFFGHRVPERELSRNSWRCKALGKLANADMFFFDPDNGIEVKSKPLGVKGSSKFLYWSEIRCAWEQGSSLLIFQHFPREDHIQYVSRRVAALAENAPGGTVVPLMTKNVLFLLSYQQRHEQKVQAALDTIRERWKGQIRVGN